MLHDTGGRSQWFILIRRGDGFGDLGWRMISATLRNCESTICINRKTYLEASPYPPAPCSRSLDECEDDAACPRAPPRVSPPPTPAARRGRAQSVCVQQTPAVGRPYSEMESHALRSLSLSPACYQRRVQHRPRSSTPRQAYSRHTARPFRPFPQRIQPSPRF